MALQAHFDSPFILRAELQAKQMIDMGIWSGIERHLFDNWCQQFDSPDERILLRAALKINSHPEFPFTHYDCVVRQLNSPLFAFLTPCPNGD